MLRFTFFTRLFAALILLNVAAFAQAAAPAPQATDNTIDFTTANGLKAIHRQVKGNEVIAVRIYFKGGVRNISEKTAGIEPVLLEVAQQGTKNFPKGLLNREIARTGTVIESAGALDYSIVAMRCVRQHFDRSWQLLTDIVLNPLFDEKELALVKEQFLSARRQESDSPDEVVAQTSDKLLFRAHPYFNRPDGTIESIGALTANDLKTYHAKMLETSRMVVVFVGDVPLGDIKTKIETSFGKLPKGNFQSAVLPEFKSAGAPEFQLINRAVQTNYIRATFTAPALDSPDYPAMSVLTNILQQLFFQEVRVKRNLSYGADANLLALGANAGNLTVTTQKPNETVRVMFEQIDFLQRQIIREEPLGNIVSGFLTSFYTKLETNDAQAARLGEYELLGGGWRRALTWLDEVRKVKPEDINRVAKTYLKNFHFAAIGNPAYFDKELFQSR
ncbi:MAG: insulinase family protein [Acidobacteria bacterium]|nr:insulinase family protein [Acidobacteriota bacterium]MBI3427239.1 insulinase family protein [Acidobacteriota bacterium]